MGTLQDIYEKHKVGDWPDKGSTHSYLGLYEAILRPYRYTAKSILELGLMSGESLKMWSEYFSGTVYGMDCDIKPIGGMADLSGAIAEGYNVRIGDATNPADVEKHFKGVLFDVVVEDCNHDLLQQLKIYKTFKPYLNKGSIYIVEDIQSIDETIDIFKSMDDEKEIVVVDFRAVKNRYDDCLVIIKDKP